MVFEIQHWLINLFVAEKVKPMSLQLEKLESVIEQYGKENYLSGNLLISIAGKEQFSRSFGEANKQLGVPNTLDTKFHIASVTKMLIATATLKLYEQGLLSLEDHPGKFIESFKTIHPGISIHHLLSHSSGLHDIYAVPNLRLEMSKLIVEKRDLKDYLIQLDQNFTPGDRWEYSSTGFIILGYILEELMGLPYDQALATLFFSPLKMIFTGCDNPRRINVGRAYGHSLENGELTNADNDKLSEVEAPGELFSTVYDLDKWCQALFSGKLLAQETMDKMFKAYYATTWDPDLSYGYGWFLGPGFRLIGGGTPGFRSEIWHYPVQDLRVIMLWNYEKVDSHLLFNRIKPALFYKE